MIGRTVSIFGRVATRGRARKNMLIRGDENAPGTVSYFHNRNFPWFTQEVNMIRWWWWFQSPYCTEITHKFDTVKERQVVAHKIKKKLLKGICSYFSLNSSSSFLFQNMPFQTKNKTRLLFVISSYLGLGFAIPFIAARFQMYKKASS